MSVIFRSLRAEDKGALQKLHPIASPQELYLMVDVHDDQAINRWMKRVEFGDVRRDHRRDRA